MCKEGNKELEMGKRKRDYVERGSSISSLSLFLVYLCTGREEEHKHQRRA